MASFQCPYCSAVMSISRDTCSIISSSFEGNGDGYYKGTRFVEYESHLQIEFYKCPNCGEYTIKAIGSGEKLKNVIVPIHPISSAKQYPDYIPQVIRSDYEEACAIVNLSPKASATLSRRCLQGMIHDFWDIKLRNLNQEITALKDKIPADLWESIDSLREMGNIGAHMEKDTNVIIDIEPNEAELLIKLIELLMKEWYINREERKKLFSDIISTNADKQEQRSNKE